MTAPIAYRAPAAARALGLPVERFHAYVAEGILPPPVRVGTDDLWPRDALEAVIRGRKDEEAKW